MLKSDISQHKHAGFSLRGARLPRRKKNTVAEKNQQQLWNEVSSSVTQIEEAAASSVCGQRSPVLTDCE